MGRRTKRSWYWRIIDDLRHRENGEIYLNWILIIGIVVYELAGDPDDSLVNALTLMTIGALSLSNLISRYHMIDLMERVKRPMAAQEFFDVPAETLRSQIYQAQDVWFVGTTLNRTVREHLSIFEEKLEDGGKLKFIVIDPATTAPEQAVLRSKDIPGRSYYEHSVHTTLQQLSTLSKYSESIEIGLLPFKPSFAMILVDPEKLRGRIFVEIYSHRSTETFPEFELSRHQDRHWYEHYSGQFNTLWEACGERTWKGHEIRDSLNTLIQERT